MLQIMMFQGKYIQRCKYIKITNKFKKKEKNTFLSGVETGKWFNCSNFTLLVKLDTGFVTIATTNALAMAKVIENEGLDKLCVFLV